ncbi:MAG: TolC family protein [Desulfuromusa sp.]|nr:TolC family protein [Desulfuromusa sp.]
MVRAKFSFYGIIQVFSLVCMFFLIGTSALSQTFNPADTIKIGLLLDSNNESSEKFVAHLQNEVESLLGNQFKISLPESKQIITDWSVEKVEAGYLTLLNDNDVDIILVVDPLSSAVIAQKGDFTKPVILYGILDYLLQEIPLNKDKKSGVHNLTYILEAHEFRAELDRFYGVFPFKNLTIVIDKNISTLIPNLETLLTTFVTLRGSQSKILYYDGDISSLYKRFPIDTDAVFLGGLFYMSADDKQKLIDHLRLLKLPSYSYQGVADVKSGALAGSILEVNWQKIGRRTALNIERILNGEDPANFLTLIDSSRRLTLNMYTANAIDFSPDWQTLAQSEQIATEQIESSRIITLESAIQEALKANLGLDIGRQSVASAVEDVAQARAAMRPSFQLSTSATQIDEEHAGLAQAERTINGSLTLNQLLFSEPVRANLAVQKYNLKSIQEAYRELMLDTVLFVGHQFLGILQAQANERISRNNLALVRKNYEVAEYRQRVGYAGGADVYRLESELATATSQLLAAQSTLWQAKIDLNDSLCRPLTEEFSVEDVQLESNLLRRYGGDQIHAAVRSPKALKQLTQFLVLEALDSVPELEQLRQGLAAQERILASHQRRRWLPDLSLNASINEVLDQSGIGSSNTSSDDTSWNLGALASWNLFEGGAIASETRQARVESNKLRKQLREASRGIELQLRKAVLDLRVLSADLQLSRSAAEAAGKNYKLVQDAYEQGAVTITALLDAQNSALSAEQSAANSVYNYYLGILQLERAFGNFSVTSSLAEQQDFFARFQEFMASQP